MATSRAIQRLLAERKSVRLDLGCGPHKQAPDWIGIDTRKLPGVDIVHDLEEFPWPLPDQCARAVVMSHFWEHVSPKKTLQFMEELHRVCAHEALLFISGPYAAEFRFVQDPTHCNPTNQATFCYWDNTHESGLWMVYRPSVFHLQSFDIIPVGGNFRDFNAVLSCCHHATTGVRCAQCQPSKTSTSSAETSGRGGATRHARTKTGRGRGARRGGRR